MYAADARHDNPGLSEKLAQIFTLRGGPAIDLTIRPAYLELLRNLGDPHLSLPSVIHVAGTNGKGSTLAMLRAVLSAAGYRTHVYTSPHLERFNERIVIAGQEIDDVLLEELLDEVLAANGAGALTFFEITTAVAFLAFARHKADFTLLETGMGGRLDCTNVVPAPLVTALTSIGLDHNEFLGATVAAIAAEKAGIIKPGVPCVTGPLPEEAAPIVAAKAQELNAPLFVAGQDYHATILPPQYEGGGLLFEFDGGRETFPQPNLAGAHQGDNAGIVLAILKLLERDDYLFDRTAIGEGLTQTKWPARLELVEKGALLRHLPPGSRLWIDGGHNPDAAAMLARQAQEWNKRGDLPLILVTAMMQTKKAEDFLSCVAPLAHLLVTTGMQDAEDCWPPEALAQWARASGAAQVESAPGLIPALDLIAARGQAARVLICGSLYLAGEALRANKAV